MPERLYCPPCGDQTEHTRNVLNRTYDCTTCLSSNYAIQQVDSQRGQSSTTSRDIGFNVVRATRTDKSPKKGGLAAI